MELYIKLGEIDYADDTYVTCYYDLDEDKGEVDILVRPEDLEEYFNTKISKELLAYIKLDELTSDDYFIKFMHDKYEADAIEALKEAKAEESENESLNESADDYTEDVFENLNNSLEESIPEPAKECQNRVTEAGRNNILNSLVEDFAELGDGKEPAEIITSAIDTVLAKKPTDPITFDEFKFIAHEADDYSTSLLMEIIPLRDDPEVLSTIKHLEVEQGKKFIRSLIIDLINNKLLELSADTIRELEIEDYLD